MNTIEARHAIAPDQDAEGVRWQPLDLVVEGVAGGWAEWPVSARFRHEAGAVIDLDGVYDGDGRRLVRFAPTQAGRWSYQVIADGESRGGGTITVREPELSEIDANANLRGHLRVAERGHHFCYADGTPFFWVGDTNWPINTVRCGIGNSDWRQPDESSPFWQYLRQRLSLGFTLIQTSFWRSYLGAPQRNEAGYPFPRNTFTGDRTALDNGDFTDLNPLFFRYLDYRMQALHDAGVVVTGHPNWIGRHVRMSLEDAAHFERYMLMRYGAFNVVFSISGEYDRGTEGWPATHGDWLEPEKRWTEDRFRLLGRLVAPFNAYRHPMTIHPGRDKTSVQHFHHEPWLDHNWTQVGGGAFGSGLPQIAALHRHAYDAKPTKPVVHSESQYEGNFMSYSDEYPNDRCSADEVRYEALAAYLSGACGHTYGANGIWQFYDPEDDQRDRQRVDLEPIEWREALVFPGAEQVAGIRSFAESVGLERWFALRPAREKVQIGGRQASDGNWIDPLLLADDRLALVYVPQGNAHSEITVSAGVLGSGDYEMRFYDPRSRSYRSGPDAARVVVTDGSVALPEVPDNQDWVIVVARENP